MRFFEVGINTPPENLAAPNVIDECPDVSTGDLEALLLGLKRAIGATIHSNGNLVGSAIALTNGATQATGNILNGLIKGDDLFKSVDDGLEGFDTGFDDGLIDTLSIFRDVPL